MSNACSFGQQACTYAKGRPGYPSELYGWISDNSPTHNLVWDVGTGSGQAARELTTYFEQVHATDLSKEQIEAAAPHPQISYLVTAAHVSNLADRSADAVTVATALHWFATPAFWEEVSRIAKDGALFSAWTYQLPKSDGLAQSEFLDPVLDIIDPFWAEGNRVCMAGYSAEALNCPFPTIGPPEFDAGGLWTGHQIVNFAESWSAHFRARENGLEDKLNCLSRGFRDKYGDETMAVSLPLSLLAFRIPK